MTARDISVHALAPTVALSPKADENTYFIARMIMDASRWLLGLVGLESNSTAETWVYAALVFLLAMAVGKICQWVILEISNRVADASKNVFYRYLVNARFFSKICRIIPALLFLILIQFTLTSRVTLATWLTRLTWFYVVWVTAVAVNTFITVLWTNIDERENKRKLPLKGLVDLAKGIVWIVAAIVVAAVLLDKSPASLLAGLGAFAAVLMLVFKDSILGVVAGVQLSENDSLHVGDWIAIGNVNGTVTEVSLTSVKITNWDKTVTTVPPYNLVSQGFTNYRSMQESNTRRIQRSYMIDADSVVPVDEAMLKKFREIPLLTDWIDKKVSQRSEGRVCNAANPAGLVDGSIETNLGIFRAYLKLYLDSHPLIDHSGGIGYCFVTTLAQTSAGIPLQIYCFTATSAWLAYEAIQASVFEHIAIMMSRFNLYTFENPSGRDTIIDGYMSPGKNPDVLFGLPYPFFNASGTPGNPAYPPQRSVVPEPSPVSSSPAVTTPSASPQPPATAAVDSK